MPHKDPETRRVYMREYARAARLTADAETKATKLAYQRKWKQARRIAKPDESRTYKRAQYAANREKLAADRRAWRKDNPDKTKATETKRAAKRKAEKPPRYVYCKHRASADRRTIPFLLTFDEWWMIWEASGVFMQRGRRSDEYCMARTGDAGPYAAGNVRICTNRENAAERNRNQRGKTHKSPPPISEATRAVMSLAQKERWARVKLHHDLATNSVLSAPTSSTNNL